MFKNPFSFEGRIRRTEYGLSQIIYYILYVIFSAVTLYEDLSWWFLFIPIIWFNLAQGAKRCHDMGNSGWFQLIPIYNPFFLIFKEGEPKSNQYGDNPKLLKEHNNDSSDNLNKELNNPSLTIPDVCPHCKNPNTKRIRLCEWCGNQII